MTFLNLAPKIYLDKKTQIAFLFIKKVKIPNKYLDFVDIFSKKNFDATRAHQVQWSYHWFRKR